MTTELIVGFLDTERASMTRWTAADFNDHAANYFTQHGHDRVCELTDGELGRIRGKRSELFERWSEVALGESLVLEFSRKP